ncbi:hypothetical protein ACET3Z_023186 [Daucus carota]
MESAESVEDSSLPESSLASVNKDQPCTEVPKIGDTGVKVVLELRVSVTGGSNLVNVQDPSSSMTPQQGQGLLGENAGVERTQNHEGFVTAAYPRLRVRKDSIDRLPEEQKVSGTEPPGYVAIYPQIKVSEVEQDASSTSGRAGIVDFEDEFREFNSSNTPVTKAKSKLSSSQDGDFVTYAQGRVSNVNKIPASASQVRGTKSRHRRQIYGEVSQANHADHIDTAAPYESAKGVVIKFGGIVKWNPHIVQRVEKRKAIEEELEAVHREVQWFRKQSEAAENDKVKVLKALKSSKRLIEELNLYLERAQMEELQANQDFELASLMVVEMEQGIADEARNAAKAQFEVAKARHDAALSELETVKEELITVRKGYATLVTERDLAVKKAEEAIFALKDIKKAVEELTAELISTRDSLESQHATLLEAEKQKNGAALALEQDTSDWEKEKKQVEEEFMKLHQNILLAKDLKSKLDAASALLRDLNFELAAYMDSDMSLESEEHSSGKIVGQDKETHSHIQTEVSLAKKKYEEVKLDIEETKEEIRLLKAAATSLNSKLESEKFELAALEQREGMASVAVASIEDELSRTIDEIAMVQVKEREAREKMGELPKKLQKASEEADHEKSHAHAAHGELQKAQEEVEYAKAAASTVQSRLLAAQKEIEASKASEKHALAALSALQETGAVQTLNNDQITSEVTLPLEDYNELNKQAQDAEEQGNQRIADALSLVEKAKETELQNLTKLEKVNSELATQKDRLEFAREKAEKAKEEKLGIERELRKWRAEHEERRKADKSSRGAVIPSKSPEASFEGKITEVSENSNPPSFEVKNAAQYLNKAPSAAVATQHTQSPVVYEPRRSESDSFADGSLAKKKKKSKFFRFFSFSGKRKKKTPS